MSWKTTPWKWLAALRVALELIGIGLLISVVALQFFPGALRGLGVADAMRRIAETPGTSSVTPPLSPADLAAILLGVATIVLATVAFLISFAAFFGIGEIRNLATRTALERVQSMEARIDASSAASVAKVDEALKTLAIQLDQLQASVREEIDQAKGLESGHEADTLAQAASSENNPDHL